jgi:hypothetical protein
LLCEACAVFVGCCSDNTHASVHGGAIRVVVTASGRLCAVSTPKMKTNTAAVAIRFSMFFPCPSRKISPRVSIMQSREDVPRDNGPSSLNSPHGVSLHSPSAPPVIVRGKSSFASASFAPTIMAVKNSSSYALSQMCPPADDGLWGHEVTTAHELAALRPQRLHVKTARRLVRGTAYATRTRRRVVEGLPRAFFQPTAPKRGHSIIGGSRRGGRKGTAATGAAHFEILGATSWEPPIVLSWRGAPRNYLDGHHRG